MSRVRFMRPHRGSVSGMTLARALGVPALRRYNSRYRYRDGDIIVNWGCSHEIEGAPSSAYINDPLMVRNAIDKRATWNLLVRGDVPTVHWTDDHSIAYDWLMEDERVLVRTSLRGSQGRGITAFSMEGTEWTQAARELPPTGTYVKVFGRNPQRVTEYRAHVVGGQVIDFVQKKRRRDYEGRPNPYVRSHRNGWIFAREGVECPAPVNAASVRAVGAVGLDFGAVDIALSRDGEVCVYEVNTAPGIEGTTLDRYVESLGASTDELRHSRDRAGCAA